MASSPTVVVDELNQSDIRLVLLVDGLIAPRRGLTGVFVRGCSGQFHADGDCADRARMNEMLANGHVQIRLDDWSMKFECTLFNPDKTYEYQVNQSRVNKQNVR